MNERGIWRVFAQRTPHAPRNEQCRSVDLEWEISSGQTQYRQVEMTLLIHSACSEIDVPQLESTSEEKQQSWSRWTAQMIDARPESMTCYSSDD